jgi:hypothetical protein
MTPWLLLRFNAFWSICKGFGNVLVGLTSAALLKRVSIDEYGATRYGSLVVFAGTCLFLPG